jgi:hypothetical protein
MVIVVMYTTFWQGLNSVISIKVSPVQNGTRIDKCSFSSRGSVASVPLPEGYAMYGTDEKTWLKPAIL